MVPLGRLLVERGLLAEEQLTFALAEQKRKGKPLGHVLVDLGFVPETTVAQALATQHGGVVKTEYGFATGFDGGSVFRSDTEPLVRAAHTDDPHGAEEASLPPVTNGVPHPEQPGSRTTIGGADDLVAAALPAEPGAGNGRIADLEAKLEATTSRIEQLEHDLASASAAQETLRAEILRLSAEAGPDRELQDRLYRARLVELEQRIDSVLSQLEDSPEAGAVR